MEHTLQLQKDLKIKSYKKNNNLQLFQQYTKLRVKVQDLQAHTLELKQPPLRQRVKSKPNVWELHFRMELNELQPK